MTMKTYAPLADLKSALAVPAVETSYDDDLARALVTATRWIDIYIGDSTVAADDGWTGAAADLTVEATPPAALVTATLALAVRFHKSPSVPFGVAGMSDQGIVAYVRSSVPEIGILLFGRRQSFGIA